MGLSLGEKSLAFGAAGWSGQQMEHNSHAVASIGDVSWSDEDLVRDLREFLPVYDRRPIKKNIYGVKSVHAFYLWFLVRKIKPAHVIESGVFKGQSTYIIEAAAPNAEIFSIEPHQQGIEYRPAHVKYFRDDFSRLDWSNLDPTRTLVFFDDHQDAPARLEQCRRLGFRHLAFDDNYPPGRGDCLSLKQALHAREPACQIRSYYEFPPIFEARHTRWGDRWDRYQTPPPLLTKMSALKYWQYFKDARYYTWFSYVTL